MLWGVPKFILSQLALSCIPTHLLPLALWAHGVNSTGFLSGNEQHRAVPDPWETWTRRVYGSSAHYFSLSSCVRFSKRPSLVTQTSVVSAMTPYLTLLSQTHSYLELTWLLALLIVLRPSRSPLVLMFYENRALTWP